MAVLLGRTSAANNADFIGSGNAGAWDFVCDEDGDLETIFGSAQVTNADVGDLEVGIYEDVGGVPGTLLGSAPVDDIGTMQSTGVWSATLSTPVSVAAGLTYWLAVYATSGQYNFEGDSSGHYSEDLSPGALPATWAEFASGTVNTIIWGEGTITAPQPAFRAAGAGVLTATSGAACTPAIPAGGSAGELLIAHVFYGGSTAAPSTPAGWTLLDGPQSLNTPGTNGRTWVFGKVAAGGDANPAFGTQAVTTPRRARVYAFVNPRSDSIANIVGGFGFDGPASSSTVSDVGVTTPEDNCVAVNLIAISDDNTIGSFTGESGGNWGEAVAEFTGTTGTPDTCMQIQTAYMATAGTINGGTVTQSAADPWGNTGFYIRGVASATGFTLDAQPGSFVLTGAVAGVVSGRVLDAQPGAYTLTGVLATLGKGYTLNAEPGVYTLTGAQAELLAARVLSADPGSLALTGFQAQTAAGRVLSADPGSFAITGALAGVYVGRALLAEPGSFAVTGAPAELLAARVLSADPGAFTLTGVLAELVFDSGTPVNHYTLDAQPGSFTLTGFDAQLLAARMLSADPGNYVLTGMVAAALADRVIVASPGEFSVTGAQADVVTARVMNALAGVFTITGSSAALEGPAAEEVERRIRTILMSRFGIY
jgi:hypothetical protein